VLRRCCDRSLSSGMLRVTSPPGKSGHGLTAKRLEANNVRLLDTVDLGGRVRNVLYTLT
jgi:hypothetical protein